MEVKLEVAVAVAVAEVAQEIHREKLQQAQPGDQLSHQ
jgi:hypothetical protein